MKAGELSRCRFNPESLPDVPQTARLGAPLRPGKMVLYRLNYSDRAKESGMPISSGTVVFMRTTRMAGPYDEIQVPRTSSKTDWEVELGVVIAREAQYLRSLEE